ncbi:MAG: hypothetical protein ACJ8DY_17075, partial [Xanthobacteraceae bacterium]
MMDLDADFFYHRDETAPPYIVLPDLGQEFYHWRAEQTRHPAEKIIPPEAWKLVRCRGTGPLRVLHADGSGPSATSANVVPLEAC